MPSVTSRLVVPFADLMLAAELPGLEPTRRAAAASFVAGRIEGMPDITRRGVLAVAAVFRAVQLLPCGAAMAGFASRRPLPVLGDYPRLVRSLGFAFVWDTWPGTRRDGSVG